MGIKSVRTKETDREFKIFAKVLEEKIKRINKSNRDLYEVQKEQVEGLIALERDFRARLIAHPEGTRLYEEFVYFIYNERRNILDARPFFRERQTTFSAHISDALKTVDILELQKYDFNFKFIQFILSCEWNPPQEMVDIARKIVDLRNEICVMNMPLGISRARLFYNKTPKAQLEFMDLVQIASEGLLTAIDKFSGPFSRVFRAVAIGRILGYSIESYCADSNTVLDFKGLDNLFVQKLLKDFVPGDVVRGVDHFGNIIETRVVRLHNHGIMNGVELTFDDGYKVICSENHKFLTEKGMVEAKNIWKEKLGVLSATNNLYTKTGTVVSPLWTIGSDKSTAVGPSKDVPNMSGINSGPLGGPNNPNSSRSQVWQNICKGKTSVQPSSRVPRMFGLDSRSSIGATGGWSEGLASKQSRSYASGSSGCEQSILQNVLRGSCGKGKYGVQNQAGDEKISRQGSRRFLRENEKSLVCPEAVQNGSLAPFQRHTNLAGSSNIVWGRQKSCGFCISGSDDLDRGGRGFSFSRSISNKAKTSEHPVAGQNVIGRSYKTSKRDLDSSFLRTIRRDDWKNEGCLDPTVYKNSALQSTRGLLTRKLVSYRPVGKRQMYDLEVSHPKHNFLLPNGVVTSNSETLVHFYPIDKRKIYRANKILGRKVELDLSALAKGVNEGIDPGGQTNASELAGLLLAQSCVSSDYTVTEKEETIRVVDRVSAPVEHRPDARIENLMNYNALSTAVSCLSILEQKLLKLKGVDLSCL